MNRSPPPHTTNAIKKFATNTFLSQPRQSALANIDMLYDNKIRSLTEKPMRKQSAERQKVVLNVLKGNEARLAPTDR